MKRIEYIPNEYGAKDKYLLKEEYGGFGLYQEICPTGFPVHQSYMIKNNKICVVCPSYNNYCKEEILDMIDEYNESGKFGVKAFKQDFGYVIHLQGDNI